MLQTGWSAALGLHRGLFSPPSSSRSTPQTSAIGQRSSRVQKFSDDSTIVGCLSRGEETEYRIVVEDFATWCERNYLQLNVTMTQELVVDLRRTKTPVTSVPSRR